MRLIDKVEEHLPWARAYLRDEYPATADERHLLRFLTQSAAAREEARQDRLFRIVVLVLAVPSLVILIWSVVGMVW